MTIESLHSGSEIETSREPLEAEQRRKIINKMQIRVASELLGPISQDENDVLFKWVARFKNTSLSEKFREIVNVHPELVDQYADLDHLHEYNQDSVIVKIEEMLEEDPVSAEIIEKMRER